MITDPAALKDAFLEEVRKAKKFFYGTVVAQAQRIDVEPTIASSFVFAPQHKRAARAARAEPSVARGDARAARRPARWRCVGDRRPRPAPLPARAAPAGRPAGPIARSQLRQQALADKGVQAMLDVFAAEIKEVEEDAEPLTS